MTARALLNVVYFCLSENEGSEKVDEMLRAAEPRKPGERRAELQGLGVEVA